MHKASFLDASVHSIELLELLEIKITRPVIGTHSFSLFIVPSAYNIYVLRLFIEYVVETVSETVAYAMGDPSTSSLRGRSAKRNPAHAAFTTFVTNVLTRAEVSTPTLLVALAYIDRAKPHLRIALTEWACERLFLGALVLASKYANDSSLKNVDWAICTGVFGKGDVGRTERELLSVLDFELGVTEGDLLAHHEGLSVRALGRQRKSTAAPLHVHKYFHRHPQRSPQFHIYDSPSPPSLSPSSSTSTSSSIGESPRTPAHAYHMPTPAARIEHEDDDDYEMSAVRSPGCRVAGLTQTMLGLLSAFPPVPGSTHGSKSDEAHCYPRLIMEQMHQHAFVG